MHVDAVVGWPLSQLAQFVAWTVSLIRPNMRCESDLCDNDDGVAMSDELPEQARVWQQLELVIESLGCEVFLISET